MMAIDAVLTMSRLIGGGALRGFLRRGRPTASAGPARQLRRVPAPRARGQQTQRGEHGQQPSRGSQARCPGHASEIWRGLCRSPVDVCRRVRPADGTVDDAAGSCDGGCDGPEDDAVAVLRQG